MTRETEILRDLAIYADGIIDDLRARLAATERERDEAREGRREYGAALDAVKAQLITMSARRDLAVHERDAALANLNAANEELNDTLAQRDAARAEAKALREVVEAARIVDGWATEIQVRATTNGTKALHDALAVLDAKEKP